MPSSVHGLLSTDATRRYRAITRDTRVRARRFAESDADGDCALDFEEFYAMAPVELRERHAPAEVRGWFDAADAGRAAAEGEAVFKRRKRN